MLKIQNYLIEDPKLEYTCKLIGTQGQCYNGQCLRLDEKGLVRQGYGVETWPNGDKWEGYWEVDQMLRGKITKTQFEYFGEIKEGKQHGFGILTDLSD